MADSMCCDTSLNTLELAFGSSSHQSAKHSLKSSYLHAIASSDPWSRHEQMQRRMHTSICALSAAWRVGVQSGSASIACWLRRLLPWSVVEALEGGEVEVNDPGELERFRDVTRDVRPLGFHQSHFCHAASHLALDRNRSPLPLSPYMTANCIFHLTQHRGFCQVDILVIRA